MDAGSRRAGWLGQQRAARHRAPRRGPSWLCQPQGVALWWWGELYRRRRALLGRPPLKGRRGGVGVAES